MGGYVPNFILIRNMSYYCRIINTYCTGIARNAVIEPLYKDTKTKQNIIPNTMTNLVPNCLGRNTASAKKY